MLQVNTILYTKDGRKTGNAIVVSDLKNQNQLELDLSLGSAYIIKSDYGTEGILYEKEIREMFYIGQIADETHKYYRRIEEKIQNEPNI